ncbi:hypothetical protein DAI22_03g213400 [Oryza sativa Japonica Group]|nr:hypothetical protein DAI22_03g213400 [Oryza sativa Japonica Group]
MALGVQWQVCTNKIMDCEGLTLVNQSSSEGLRKG